MEFQIRTKTGLEKLDYVALVEYKKGFDAWVSDHKNDLEELIDAKYLKYLNKDAIIDWSNEDRIKHAKIHGNILYQISYYEGDKLILIHEEQFPKDQAMVACKNCCSAYTTDHHQIENGFAADYGGRRWMVEPVPTRYYELLDGLKEKMAYLNDLFDNNKIKLADYKNQAREAHSTLVHIADSNGVTWTKQPGYDIIYKHWWDLGYN